METAAAEKSNVGEKSLHDVIIENFTVYLQLKTMQPGEKEVWNVIQDTNYRS